MCSLFLNNLTLMLSLVPACPARIKYKVMVNNIIILIELIPIYGHEYLTGKVKVN